MAQIQIEAHIQATSETTVKAGRNTALTAAIVVPRTSGFGPVPVAKNTLKVSDAGVIVTPKAL